MYTSLSCASNLAACLSAQWPAVPRDRRDRDRVQMQAHAEDERRDDQPVQDRKPPFGASEQDRPRQRLMDQRSLNLGIHRCTRIRDFLEEAGANGKSAVIN